MTRGSSPLWNSLRAAWWSPDKNPSYEIRVDTFITRFGTVVVLGCAVGLGVGVGMLLGLG